jgi:TonB family protein
MNLEQVRREARSSRTRMRRATVGSVIVHVVVLGWIVLSGQRQEGPPTITEVTWLDPKDLEPPKPPEPEPVVPPAPEPAPPVAASPKPAAVRAATPKPPAPRPVPQGRAQVDDAPGRSGVARAPAPSGGGEKGRAAGARVARDLAQTKVGIDNVLSSLAGTIPASTGASGGGGGRRVDDRFAVTGGRGDGKLPNTDGDLRGTGLGAVGAGAGAGGGTGSGRGVRRTGVALVDDGIETSGDGAGVSGRDSRSLMAVVQRYVAGIKFCYDNALKKTPSLDGKITLQMDITAAGEVTNLDPLDDSMGNAALQRCILSQVEGWKFPAIPAGTVRFTLPLVFTPPQGVAP